MKESKKPLSQARVLVVEDDINNRLVVTALLQVAGIRPEHIFAIEHDVLSFLQQPQAPSIDLILLDLQLPGKDGYTILQELKAAAPLSHIPVVALTANVMPEDIERVRRSGFDGFIGKPIDGPRFPGFVQQLLAGGSVWAMMT